MAGRTPLPTNVHRLNGNPGKRKRGEKEPRPAYLETRQANALRDELLTTDEARRYWDVLYPALRDARLITIVDVPGFVEWCESLGESWRARKVRAGVEKQLAGLRDGIGVDLGYGQRFISAEDTQTLVDTLQKQKDALTLELKWAHERTKDLTAGFGGTPAARTKIELVDAQLDLFEEGGEVVMLPLAVLHGAGKNNLPANAG